MIVQARRIPARGAHLTRCTWRSRDPVVTACARNFEVRVTPDGKGRREMALTMFRWAVDGLRASDCSGLTDPYIRNKNRRSTRSKLLLLDNVFSAPSGSDQVRKHRYSAVIPFA